MGKSINISGNRFGRLIAIRIIGKKRRSNVWLCKCDCGNQTNVVTYLLRNGAVKSCGCLSREKASVRSKSKLNSKDAQLKSKEANGIVEETMVTALVAPLRKDNKTGVKGVGYYECWKKYGARITFKKKTYWLGLYDTLAQASKARKEAEKQLYKPFLDWYNEKYKFRSIACKN